MIGDLKNGRTVKSLTKLLSRYGTNQFNFVSPKKLKFPKKFNQNFIKAKIKSLKVKDLAHKALISDKVGTEASIIAKVKSIRSISNFNWH